MFQETNEGSTHYFGDGCGEPAHNQNMKNTFGLLLKDKFGNEITLWQAKSGQIFIGFNRGIPLSFVNIVEGNLETYLRDIEDFDELKYKDFYHSIKIK